MSEVKRYDVLHSSIGGVDEVESECGEYVRADDALSRIAVLREELARVQKISDNYYSLTVEANQLLADAKRRNGELEVLLMNTAEVLRSGNGYGWEDAQADIIDAALKPTESGASE